MENRVIVEYAGMPDESRDTAIDHVAQRLGLEPGDTGYSFSERLRDHSIYVGEDRAAAYEVAAAFRRSFSWATVRVYPEDDA